VATLIRAAGGVLWRPPATGPEICLVHRPRYDDWSLPKGKLDAGEHPLAAAVREVREETGVRAAPQVYLNPVRYRVRDGLPKLVEYWSMRVLDGDGEFEPNEEVDGVGWMPLPTALERLSYEHDAGVLREFAALPPVTGLVLLIRHAEAGERGSWRGPDTARPLTTQGQAQAQALASVLKLFAPTQLVSAAPRRCVQTLTPLAAELDLPVEVDPVFDEPSGSTEPISDPARPGARLREFALAAGVTVVCSQRGVIPQLLAWLTAGNPEAYLTAKSAGWVLPFSGTTLLRTDPVSPLLPSTA
jgi:8-oxo-dGTP pyrophosphatase MutT (NUDIX family)